MLSRQAATLALGYACYGRHKQYVNPALDTLLENVQDDKVSHKAMFLAGKHERSYHQLTQLPRPEVEVRRASFDAMVTITANSETPSELKSQRQNSGPIP
jgi:hypothetical protein